MTSKTPGNRRPLLVLLVLALASATATAGASLLSAALPLIKAEFGYSDTQLGLLTGYGSALAYAVLALPISALAARWGNSRVFGACLVLYSLANACTAACSSLWQLLATRFASSVGPAASFPLGQALVSDYYPPEKRSGALAIYTVGDFVGISGGLALGGFLALRLGWRQAFVVFGLAGIAVALLQMWIARDAHAPQGGRPTTQIESSHWFEDLKAVVRNRAYLHIMLGYSWASFATFGLIQWMPSFYNRQFGLPTDQAAAFFGGAYAIGALMGVLAGGALGNRMGSGNTAQLLKFCMGSFLMTFPLISTVLFAPNLQVAFVAHVLATFVGAMPNGPVLSLIQNEMPRRLRVLGSSLFLLSLTLLGAGGGPLLIGILSDTLAPRFGTTSLRFSMLAVKLMGLMLFVHLGIAYWSARRLNRVTPSDPEHAAI